MQATAIFSFLLAVITMALLFFEYAISAKIVFGISLFASVKGYGKMKRIKELVLLNQIREVREFDFGIFYFFLKREFLYHT